MQTCNTLFSRRFIFPGWKCTNVHQVFNDSLHYQCQNKQDDITVSRTNFCVFSWHYEINNIHLFVMDSICKYQIRQVIHKISYLDSKAYSVLKNDVK